MRYIKSITQQKLSFLLAIYIGLFMNGAVFYRRFGSYAHDFTVWKGISAVVELAATVLVTFFLLRLLSLFGRRSWRILASLVVLFSAGASYYMTFLNVVIGYGIIASVMTTDIDLSKEVVGLNFILWLIAVSALPLILIWNNRCRYTLLRQLRTPGQRIRSLAVVVLAGIMVWAPIRLLDIQQKKVERATGVDLPSYGGVVANSYLPSNWLSALGLYAWARVDESSDNNSLLNPAKKFTYQAPQNVNDTYVVFIIGETTRWDHMGIFGYERNTTPKLAQEKNLAAFRGYSCDTATKLSLRCMFVRQGGAEDNPQRTLKEQNIFAVLKQLGFSSDLYAMQSEMWFYSNTMADNIAYREQIGAEPRNRGKPVDDMLLVDEMQQSLGRNPDGKHLIILHTKGSHFNYTQRYPRSFAQWKPECIGVDSGCTKAQMINSYDNSVTYVDHFISSVIDQVRDKKAIVLAPPAWQEGGSMAHLLGTDDVGRDVLSRLMYGARLSLLVGCLVVVLSLIMGVILGLIAGYFGGLVDNIIMRVVDIMLALPSLLLALVLVAIFGPSIGNAALALTFVALPHYVRLTRAAVLVEVNRDYVTASRVAGAGAMRQMFINIFPNCLAPLIVQASLGFSNAILDMAALGFLGMGAQPPTPEWGTMLSDVLQFAQSAWWVVTFPGLAILLTVLAFNLMGDGLRDALDPKLKQ